VHLRFFRAFFVSCKANARVKLAKMGHGPHSSKVLCCSMYCFVSFYVLFVCNCVLYYCHRVATQLQLTKMYQSTSTAYALAVFGMISPYPHLYRFLLKVNYFGLGSHPTSLTWVPGPLSRT